MDAYAYTQKSDSGVNIYCPDYKTTMYLENFGHIAINFLN